VGFVVGAVLGVVARVVLGAAFVGATVVARPVVVDAKVVVLAPVLVLVLLHAASAKTRLATIAAVRSVALRMVLPTTGSNARSDAGLGVGTRALARDLRAPT
jgi:hypothetical protein